MFCNAIFGKRFLLLGAALVLALAGLTTIGLTPGQAQQDNKEFNLIYVPTEEKVIERMFELAKVNKNDTIFDLGCGDGRICAMACKKFNCSAVGIDLNPERIKECMETIKTYKVDEFVNPKYQLEYRLGNALTQRDFDRASVVMLYMLPEFMDLLEPIA